MRDTMCVMCASAAISKCVTFGIVLYFIAIVEASALKTIRYGLAERCILFTWVDNLCLILIKFISKKIYAV